MWCDLVKTFLKSCLFPLIIVWEALFHQSWGCMTFSSDNMGKVHVPIFVRSKSQKFEEPEQEIVSDSEEIDVIISIEDATNVSISISFAHNNQG